MFVSKVFAVRCLAMCDKDTEDAVARTRTGIKIGIGICEQKHSRAHSHSVTLSASHTFFADLRHGTQPDKRCKLQH